MTKNKTYYIYVLRCQDNSLYTGITTDVKRRFDEHISKCGLGAKYTRSRKPISVAVIWSCMARSEAAKLEYAFKKLSKKQKESIVSNPENLGKMLCDRIDISVYKLEKHSEI